MATEASSGILGYYGVCKVLLKSMTIMVLARVFLRLRVGTDRNLSIGLTPFVSDTSKDLGVCLRFGEVAERSAEIQLDRKSALL